MGTGARLLDLNRGRELPCVVRGMHGRLLHERRLGVQDGKERARVDCEDEKSEGNDSGEQEAGVEDVRCARIQYRPTKMKE